MSECKAGGNDCISSYQHLLFLEDKLVAKGKAKGGESFRTESTMLRWVLCMVLSNYSNHVVEVMYL